MGLYNANGNYIFTTADANARGLYAPDGSWYVNVDSGLPGLYGPNGCLNVTTVSPTALVGSYAPNGNWNVADGTGYYGVTSPGGAMLATGLAPLWAVSADSWQDFQSNRSFGFPSGLVDTHSQNINAQSLDGTFSLFSPNTIVRTDLGLQTVPTRTNLVTWSSNLFDASWIVGTNLVPQTQTTVKGLPMSSFYSTANSSSSLSKTIALSVSTTYSASFYSTTDLTSFTTQLVLSPTSRVVPILTSLVSPGLYLNQVTFTTDATENSALFNVGIVNAPATTVFTVGAPQIEAGAFATLPILTSASTILVNGDQQVFSGLGTQLSTGVAGFIQLDLRGFDTGSRRILEFNDGTVSNRAVVAINASNISCILFSGGSVIGSVTVTTGFTTGVITVAFAVSASFLYARAVGFAAPAVPAAPGSWPAGINSANIGGSGYISTNNIFQMTKKLSLKYGPQDQASFDAMYAKAVIAHTGSGV